MPTFDLREIEAIQKGKLRFLKLVEPKYCRFDEFVYNIRKGKQTNFTKELNTIFSRMQIMAEKDQIMPSTWFKPVKDRGRAVAYEFKTKSLRVYCVKKEPDVIVVLGGFKKNQKKDIAQLIKLINSDLFQHELAKL